jgi:AP-3 complex subunit beta
MIAPVMLLAIKECVRDMSAYVRKVAAHAIPKLYVLDPDLQPQLIECIEFLLGKFLLKLFNLIVLFRR